MSRIELTSTRGVDEALVAAARGPHARAALADHQRADQPPALDDELSVRDCAGAAREIDDLLAIRRALDLAEAGEIEIEQARREVVNAGPVVAAAPDHVVGRDAALVARRLPELSCSPSTLATSPAAQTFGTFVASRRSAITAPFSASVTPLPLQKLREATTPSAAATSPHSIVRPCCVMTARDRAVRPGRAATTASPSTTSMPA